MIDTEKIIREYKEDVYDVFHSSRFNDIFSSDLIIWYIV